MSHPPASAARALAVAGATLSVSVASAVWLAAADLPAAETSLEELIMTRTNWTSAIGHWCSTLLRPRGDTLRDLDDRTLADIGLRRTEISSIEAELGGRAAPTRRRVVPLGAQLQT